MSLIYDEEVSYIMPDEDKTGSRRRQPIAATYRGQVVPISAAMEIIKVNRPRMQVLIKSAMLPAFRYVGSQLERYDPAEIRPGRGPALFFYRGDLDAYIAYRQQYQRNQEENTVSYSEEERDLVLKEARKQMKTQGYVNRTQIRRDLHWHSTKAPIIRAVCDTHGFPLRYPHQSTFADR